MQQQHSTSPRLQRVADQLDCSNQFTFSVLIAIVCTYIMQPIPAPFTFLERPSFLDVQKRVHSQQRVRLETGAFMLQCPLTAPLRNAAPSMPHSNFPPNPSPLPQARSLLQASQVSEHPEAGVIIEAYKRHQPTK